MMDKLKEQRAEAIEEAGAILNKVEGENRELTSEEETKVDALHARAAELAVRIERAEKQAKLAGTIEKPVKTPIGGAAKTDTGASKSFATFGEQLQAVRMAAIQPHNIDKRLLEVRAGTGLAESVSADGGFLVQTDFSDELLRNVFETGILASRVRRIPISANANSLKINAIDESSRVDGSRWGGIQAFWLDEGATKTKSKPKFRQMSLSLHKLIGLVYATDELLEDAAALEAVIRQGFAEEFGFKVDDAIFNGDGAGKPLGILSSDALVSVAKETGQAASTVDYNNIAKMYSRLWSRSRANSVWLINQDILPQLFGLSIPVGTGGVPVFQPANQAAGQPFNTLFGRPLLEIEHAATLGTKGDIVLADLSQYLMIEKGGMKSAASIHVQFTTDETTFRFVMRVDGQPVWAKPITPFKGSNTVSPFISLDARA